MRLHHLRIAAFGPFADSVEVDFDTLGEAGLFLLSGATGAGKTSVLDAVCFALYGDVPGDRGTAKRLRSDHAAPDAAPQVVLETTVAGRRFRFVRSPAWLRPKKRGSGTTPQQSQVTCSELVDGEWVTLSSRLDETGDLVSRLLGMNLAQFTQVAMLPQGQFQAFLRAGSDERHDLLQRLFRTGRFRDVEQWLRDRRVALRRSGQAHHDRVADLVSRLSETADEPLPPSIDPHDLGPGADDGSLLDWSAAQLGAARLALEAATARVEPAVAAERVARAELDGVREDLERRRRHDAALAELDELEAQHDAQRSARGRLERARAAVAVTPLARALDDVRARRADCRTEVRRLLLALDDDTPLDSIALDEVDALERADQRTLHEAVERLDRQADAALARATRARAAIDTETRRADVVRRLATARERAEQVDHDRAAADRRAVELPEVVGRLRARVETARLAEASIAPLEAACADHDERLAAHVDVASLTQEHDGARASWLDVRAQRLELGEALVALQQARIDGMAAELAGALVVGCSCPVCGSADHPHRAAPAPGAPDAAAERDARRRLDDANALEVVHDGHVRSLHARLSAARARAGDSTPDALESRRSEDRARLEQARRDASGLDRLVDELDETERALRHLTDEQRAVAEEATRIEGLLASLGAEVAAHDLELDEILAGAHTSVARAVEHHERLAGARRTARDAVRALAEAEAAEHVASQRLVAAAEDAGFDCPDAALAAVLAPAVREQLATTLAEHEQRLAAVRRVLAEPGAPDPELDLGTPDLVGLERRHEHCVSALGSARAAEHTWRRRESRLSGLHDDLVGELEAWRPARAELDLTAHLAAFVEGKSPDNRLQMRLSAYVLSYRLSQVVAAANERLTAMSARRYALEHTEQRGARDRRGGLSLVVRDDWSGESRDPATLSGGETFVVSLALALGLADVISDEAGGARLDTLFVDEGFGSLDADTLDDVMDTLDGLRDGGRVVGVVSHVAEMRDRIPTQLVVRKARGGSTLAVCT